MHEQKSENHQRHGFAWLFGQMMRLPFTAFAFSLEMLVKTFHEFQRVAESSVELFTGEDGHKEDKTIFAHETKASVEKEKEIKAETDLSANEKEIDKPSDENKARVKDKDLRDDLLKLVRYKILFVKREYEHAFREQEELIAENIDATTFATWKVAEFVQRLTHDKTKVPAKWLAKNYPPDEPKYRTGDTLKGLPEEDKKYLRVFYEVVERYPREKFKFEEQQIEVLQEIRDNIKSVAESVEKKDTGE
jgi:hypothetical protein